MIRFFYHVGILAHFFMVNSFSPNTFQVFKHDLLISGPSTIFLRGLSLVCKLTIPNEAITSALLVFNRLWDNCFVTWSACSSASVDGQMAWYSPVDSLIQSRIHAYFNHGIMSRASSSKSTWNYDTFTSIPDSWYDVFIMEFSIWFLQDIMTIM